MPVVKKAASLLALLRSSAGALARRRRVVRGTPMAVRETAMHELKGRRKMEHLFGQHLFGEPSRDILLDLFLAEDRGKPVALSSGWIASGVSAATALRFVANLEKAGFVQRKEDFNDGDDIHISLTAEGRDRMIAYLRSSDTSPSSAS
ncbi:hypothetical protein [Sphingomonas bacterium]|uniref:hypothetical protein n=1 Tax=Sphingomonas bacterium TaxID=1895847 RepID=UPI00157705A7|nr:hypothetical protein [Sphingomonas bacterium]